MSMYDYIKKLINSLTENMMESKHSAAPEHLFQTDDGQAIKLSKEMSDLFHKITAQVLWMSKRGRPDLQLGTTFLCTRVQSPDERDFKKLKHHQMMNLQSTSFLPLILKADRK